MACGLGVRDSESTYSLLPKGCRCQGFRVNLFFITWGHLCHYSVIIGVFVQPVDRSTVSSLIHDSLYMVKGFRVNLLFRTT